MEIQQLLTKQVSLTWHTGQGKVALGVLLFMLFSVFDLNKGNTHFGFYFGEQKRIKRCFSSALLSSRGSHTVSRGGLAGGCGHPVSLQLSWPLFPAPLGTWLGVLPIYCSGISVVMVLWGGCWGPGAVGHRSHQHKIVYVCPQLCKIYTKGIKTKLTAEINVLTLGFHEAFG